MVKKVGHVNDLVEMPHCQKKKQIYGNLGNLQVLAISCTACEGDEENEFPDWRATIEVKGPKLGDQLSSAL